MNYPNVKLSDVLRQRKEFITIDDELAYKLCRVQTNRKGVVLRSITKGADIKTKKQQICNAGEFIVATIDAKAGGYGFIPDELDGAIVSSEYQLYEINTLRLMPDYLRMIITTDIIQSQIRPMGTTNHARIYPEVFLNAVIPLPSLPTQLKIAEIFEAVSKEIDAFEREVETSKDLLSQLKQSIIRDAASGQLLKSNQTWEKVPIGDLLTLVNGRAFKPEEWNGDIESGLPIIRIQNLNNPLAPYNYYCGDVEEKYIVNKGMLLFSWSGSKGSSFGPHIWNGRKAILNQHTYIVHHDQRLLKQFLYIVLKNAVFDVENNLHGGVGIVHITKCDLEKICISLPPIGEQQRTIEKVQGLLANCKLIENTLQEKQYQSTIITTAVVNKLINPEYIF
ncbi:MAG: restriction endonuclease subunit S [Kiritimatiellia bacterium]|nr:restriction endonuclease subunit S [Ruminiclostridium sp.]